MCRLWFSTVRGRSSSNLAISGVVLPALSRKMIIISRSVRCGAPVDGVGSSIISMRASEVTPPVRSWPTEAAILRPAVERQMTQGMPFRRMGPSRLTPDGTRQGGPAVAGSYVKRAM